MNAIICSPQGNVHRTRHANINSSVVSRLSRVSDLSSLTSSISMISRSKYGGRKAGVKNRSKMQRIVDELVNCGSLNQQLNTLKRYYGILISDKQMSLLVHQQQTHLALLTLLIL